MPRISKEDKARNRQNIVDAAGRLFRSQGIDGVGIADLMKAAGLTHGGFYNHFPSKEALAVEVCDTSFAASLGNLAEAVETASGTAGVRGTAPASAKTGTGEDAEAAEDTGAPGADAGRRSALTRVVEGYLCAEHRDDPDGGCPSAALATDAWRQSDEVQAAYVKGVEGYLAGFGEEFSRMARERGETLTADAARGEAVRLLSEMVGSMVLSRAVRRVEPGLSDEILRTSREGLSQD